MRFRPSIPMIGAVTAVMLLGACSSSKNAASPTTTAASAVTTSAPATSAPGGTTNGAPGAGTQFCSIGDTLDASLSTLGNGASTATALKDTFENVIPGLLVKAKSLAPADLKADVDKIAGATTQIGTLLAKYDYDVTKAGSDPDLQTIVNDPAVTAASDRLNAYCGTSG